MIETIKWCYTHGPRFIACNIKLTDSTDRQHTKRQRVLEVTGFDPTMLKVKLPGVVERGQGSEIEVLD